MKHESDLRELTKEEIAKKAKKVMNAVELKMKNNLVGDDEKLIFNYGFLGCNDVSIENVNEIEELLAMVFNITTCNTYKKADIVYLLDIEHDSGIDIKLDCYETFISANEDSIQQFATRYIPKEVNDFEKCIVSLHEFDSYEEAYKVALQMKESSMLCYSK